jgi:hypothetical protein
MVSTVPESVRVCVGSVLVSYAQLGSERAKTNNTDALRIAFRCFMYPPFVAGLIYWALPRLIRHADGWPGDDPPSSCARCASPQMPPPESVASVHGARQGIYV